MAIIDTLKYLLTVETDSKAFSTARKDMADLSHAMRGLAVAGGAIFGFTKLVSDQVTQTDRLAKSVGTTSDIAEAFGFEMKKIGLGQENFIDLMEEMNNKMGEMKGLGEFTAVEESLDILNLRFEDLNALSPEKQFAKIAEASLKMADSQKAVTAVDMLMGGEANKLLGSLRAQGLSYEDVIRKQQMYNFQTEKTRRGAMKFSNATMDLMRIINSLSKALAGTLGEAMSDVVNGFMEWVTVNKKVIESGLEKFVKVVSTAFGILWTALRSVGRVLSGTIDMMGGFEKVSQFIISGVMLFAVTKLIQGFRLLFFTIRAIPLMLAKFAPILVLTAIFDDLRSWVNGGNSIMGIIIGDYNTWLPQFMEGLDVIKDLTIYAFDSVVEAIKSSFTFIGDFMMITLLRPINFAIMAINQLFEGLNGLGDSALFKKLGVDFNVAPMEQITADSAKQAIGSAVQTAGTSIVNATTEVVVNVANATSIEAERLVQKAIIGSMEHERQKLQSPTK